MKYTFIFLLTLSIFSCTKEQQAPIYGSLALRVKGYLQGAYDPATGLMRKDINRNSKLPYYSPYGSGEHLPSNPDSNIVDWVQIQLWKDGQIRGTRDGLILSNGICTDAFGRTFIDIQLNQPSYDSIYHIVLRHRNHLAIRTKFPINFAQQQNMASVNFCFADGICYQNQPYTPTVQLGAMWCMRAGNANGDSVIKDNGPGNDPDFIQNKTLHGLPVTLYEYSGADVDMNGKVDMSDYWFVKEQALGGSISWIIREQL